MSLPDGTYIISPVGSTVLSVSTEKLGKYDLPVVTLPQTAGAVPQSWDITSTDGAYQIISTESNNPAFAFAVEGVDAVWSGPNVPTPESSKKWAITEDTAMGEYTIQPANNTALYWSTTTNIPNPILLTPKQTGKTTLWHFAEPAW